MTFDRLAETALLPSGHHSVWVPPVYGNVRETIYIVTQEDLGRIDLIAHKAYYGAPGAEKRWWPILHYNKIADPFSLAVGDRLIIPHWQGFREVIAPSSGRIDSPPLLQTRRPIIPPYSSPLTLAADQEADGVITTPVDVKQILLNFSFPLPTLQPGKAHIQLQLSASGDFDVINFSRMTQTSTNRWYYYDHTTNNGNGGHRQFPVDGLDSVLFEGKLVYFQIESTDGLVRGLEYFPRYRVFLNNIDQQWVATPPIIIPYV